MTVSIFKRKSSTSTLETTATWEERDSRSVLFQTQFQHVVETFKPFLGAEFLPWFNTLEFPDEVVDALDSTSIGLFYLHAFVFHLAWDASLEEWQISWRVDESKLSSHFPLDRPMACEIFLKTRETRRSQSGIDVSSIVMDETWFKHRW